ncbi:cation transporter [Desulfotalea psychrophila]|nr:cation transporter [Desulfotalea psychrophila]
MTTCERNRKGLLAVQVGLAANTILAVLKCSIGIVGNSPALLADGINSTSDVAYGVVMAIFMKLSGRPADREHPYGHEQLESVAAVVVGAFVVSTAIAIFWNSINGIYEIVTEESIFTGASMLALWVCLGTAVFKVWLSFWTGKIGKETKNTAVEALAHDHRNDIFAALAAAIGVFFGRSGVPWVDPLAGAIVSLVILYTGVDILRSATADLMNTLPGKRLRVKIHDVLASVDGVQAVEEIYAHRFGPYLMVNLTIGVDGLITVAQGDEIATCVEKVLLEEIEFMRRVYVHYHPVATCNVASQCKKNQENRRFKESRSSSTSMTKI